MSSLTSLRKLCLSSFALLAAAGGADATEESRRAGAETA